MSSQILQAVVGDPVYIDGIRHVVQPRCEAPARSCVCVTCRQLLANDYQLEAHIEHGGTHLIARYCTTHGPEDGPCQ